MIKIVFGDKTNMTESQLGEVFIRGDSQGKFVQEVVKYGIHGKAKTLVDIAAAAKKNLEESRSRLKDLKTFFRDDKNEGKNSILTESTLLSITLTILSASYSFLMRKLNYILRCYATISLTPP